MSEDLKNGGATDLLQVPHHVLLVAPEDAAEELDDLLVVEVVHALHNPWEQQLHRQVEIPVELIWGRRRTSASVQGCDLRMVSIADSTSDSFLPSQRFMRS